MMLNEKLFGLVKDSILSDRNMKAGNVTEIKIAKAYIELTIEDNADKIKIKRETKENLKTYWNVTMQQNDSMQEFIKNHHITFTEFRNEFEQITKDVHGEIDLENCVEEALNNLADQKITSNTSRIQKSHNAGKKKEEIHGEGKPETIALPEPQRPDEPLALDPPAEMKDAEKVEEIEEAEIVEDGYKTIKDGEGIEDIEIPGEEKKEDEGLKAAEEFLEKQKPKKKAGRPKKIQQKGV